MGANKMKIFKVQAKSLDGKISENFTVTDLLQKDAMTKAKEWLERKHPSHRFTYTVKALK